MQALETEREARGKAAAPLSFSAGNRTCPATMTLDKGRGETSPRPRPPPPEAAPPVTAAVGGIWETHILVSSEPIFIANKT